MRAVLLPQNLVRSRKVGALFDDGNESYTVSIVLGAEALASLSTNIAGLPLLVAYLDVEHLAQSGGMWVVG